MVIGNKAQLIKRLENNLNCANRKHKINYTNLKHVLNVDLLNINHNKCCSGAAVKRCMLQYIQISNFQFFPGPQAFCKKAVERVRSEKNILNSSVEWVEWSGWSGFFRKSHMYVHHQIGLNELINMMYFIFNLNVYFSRN